LWREEASNIKNRTGRGRVPAHGKRNSLGQKSTAFNLIGGKLRAGKEGTGGNHKKKRRFARPVDWGGGLGKERKEKNYEAGKDSHQGGMEASGAERRGGREMIRTHISRYMGRIEASPTSEE